MIPSHIMEYFVAVKKTEAALYPCGTIANKYLLWKRTKIEQWEGSFMCVCVCVHIYIHIHINIHIYMCAYIYIYTYT